MNNLHKKGETVKKLILLCTMLYAGQMYSMDPTSLPELRRTGPEQKTEYWNLLPKEVLGLVVQALYTSNNPDEAIHAIIAMSQTNKALNQLIHGDIKNFTALMNLLAKKFPTMSRKDIAEKFNTEIASYYLLLATPFENNDLSYLYCGIGPYNVLGFKNSPIETLKKFLLQGLDPNFSWTIKGSMSIPAKINSLLFKLCVLLMSCTNDEANVVSSIELLLQYGAIADDEIIDYLNEHIEAWSDSRSNDVKEFVKRGKEALEIIKKYEKTNKK